MIDINYAITPTADYFKCAIRRRKEKKEEMR